MTAKNGVCWGGEWEGKFLSAPDSSQLGFLISCSLSNQQMTANTMYFTMSFMRGDFFFLVYFGGLFEVYLITV
jgi:hypothetical protein